MSSLGQRHIPANRAALLTSAVSRCRDCRRQHHRCQDVSSALSAEALSFRLDAELELILRHIVSVKNLGDTDAARCIQWQISCLIFISKRLASFYTGHSCFQLTGAVICNRYRDGSRSRIVDHSCTCRIRSSFRYRIFIYPCFSECNVAEVIEALPSFTSAFLTVTVVLFGIGATSTPSGFCVFAIVNVKLSLSFQLRPFRTLLNPVVISTGSAAPASYVLVKRSDGFSFD